MKLESLGISIEQTVWSLIMITFGFALIYVVPLAFRFEYWQLFIGLLNATLLGSYSVIYFICHELSSYETLYRHGDGIGYDCWCATAESRRAHAACTSMGKIEKIEEHCEEELECPW